MPFFRFPFPYPYSYKSLNSCATSNSFKQFSSNKLYNEKSINNENSKKSSKKDFPENCFFELFGIKLHFDDILILCLLFFLYSEEVKDDELFISLILLLLS